MEETWWAKNRFTHFMVVATDLIWKVIRYHQADVGFLINAIRISWNLTKKEGKDGS